MLRYQETLPGVMTELHFRCHKQGGVGASWHWQELFVNGSRGEAAFGLPGNGAGESVVLGPFPASEQVGKGMICETNAEGAISTVNRAIAADPYTAARQSPDYTACRSAAGASRPVPPQNSRDVGKIHLSAPRHATCGCCRATECPAALKAREPYSNCFPPPRWSYRATEWRDERRPAGWSLVWREHHELLAADRVGAADCWDGARDERPQNPRR